MNISIEEREPFLMTIADAPDEDLPRLIYADFLEERGDPGRAEFIRLQCLYSSARSSGEERAALCDSYYELLRRDGTRWAADLPKINEFFWSQYERGFCSAAYARQPGAELWGVRRPFRATPMTPLTLHATNNRDLANLCLTALEDLRVLTLRGERVGNEGAISLAESPTAGRLRILDLSDTRVGNDGMSEILKSPYCAALRVLRLRRTSVNTRGAEEILSTTAADRLTELDIRGTDLDAQHRKALSHRFGRRVLT